jgi:ribonuclease HI
MTLSPDLRKLLLQALAIRHSAVPMHRVLDILATEDGDVSEAVNRFRDIRNPELRKSFHHLAVLLREMEKQAGLTPSWAGESGPKDTPKANPAGASKEKKPSNKSPKFAPSELEPFEDDVARGGVDIAKVFVDGASKGNPGEAGIGVVMFAMDGRKIAQVSRAIGKATNNIAEYTALIEALHLGRRMGVKSLCVLSDSELMVHQMNGVYKIKNPEIFQKVKEAKALVRGFGRFTISHIAREHNALADALSTAKIPKREAPDAVSPQWDMMGALETDPDDGATG